MPTPDPVQASAAHVLVEFLAAIVLIAGGLVVLGLADRRRRRGQRSPVVFAVPDQPAAAVERGLFIGATLLALAGMATALAPLLQAGLDAESAALGGALGGALGVVLGALALAFLLLRRFGLPRLGRTGLLRLRTALSIGLLPLVTLAVIAVVVLVATPSGAATLHH